MTALVTDTKDDGEEQVKKLKEDSRKLFYLRPEQVV